MTDDYPGPFLFFACLHALVPRVLNSCVTSTSAVFEPGTAASTATHFPRFRDDATFGAYGIDGRRRAFWWVFLWALVKDTKKKNVNNIHRAMGYY